MSSTFYGKSKGGVEISFPSCPTVRAQAQALASARVKKTDPMLALIIPESWNAGERGNQYMVEVPPDVSSRFSRVWGVMAACSDTESYNTPTPYQFNIVLKLNFRFSEDRAQADNTLDIQMRCIPKIKFFDRGEFADSHIYVRTLAYSGLYCDDIPWCSFRRGDCVTGVIECAHDPKKPEIHPSSVLVGWKFTTFAELPLKTRLKELFFPKKPSAKYCDDSFFLPFSHFPGF